MSEEIIEKKIIEYMEKHGIKINKCDIWHFEEEEKYYVLGYDGMIYIKKKVIK